MREGPIKVNRMWQEPSSLERMREEPIKMKRMWQEISILKRMREEPIKMKPQEPYWIKRQEPI